MLQLSYLVPFVELNTMPAFFLSFFLFLLLCVAREGDIAVLNAQAVTSATNEAMTDFRHPATRSVFDKAGPGLLQECRQQIQSEVLI